MKIFIVCVGGREGGREREKEGGREEKGGRERYNKISFHCCIYATAGVDYTSISEESLFFQPGDTRRCITFNVVEDDIVEGEESLTVQIQSSMLVIGIPNVAEVNIVDSSREYKYILFVCINELSVKVRMEGNWCQESICQL